MVHRCCIPSCGMSVRVAEAKGLSYHIFPTKEPLREQWIQAISPHLENPEAFKIVPRYTRVCSRHFRKKDYSMDNKKRARLNSSAVPAVFPRKNSPIIIPNVLGSPVKAKQKSDSSSNLESSSKSKTAASSTSKSVDENILLTTSSPTLNTLSWTLDTSQEGIVDRSGNRKEFFIESAVLVEDQLTLTVRDPEAGSSSSLSQEDLSQSSNLSQNEDNDAPQKKRKRRKWNRSAFDRPAKDKKKVTSKEVNIDGVGEALADISLTTLLAITTPDLPNKYSDSKSVSIVSNNSYVPEGSTLLQPVTLPLSNSTVPSFTSDQVQHLNTIEQELLQSIQAVSINSGEPDTTEASGERLQTSNVTDILEINKSISSFVHHSSEESIFSTEDDSTSLSTIDLASLGLQATVDVTTTSENYTPSSSDTLAHRENEALKEPTIVEIENLAQHFNTSLLTNPGFLNLNLDELHIPNDNDNSEEIVSPNRISTEHLVADQWFSSPQAKQCSKSSSSITKSGFKKKLSEDVRLPGVTKKHKKEKLCGRFSVERFSHSDKDIEYYTGFSSFKHFEAFFRSLEAYVERLRVTDAMFGVTNLDKLQPQTEIDEKCKDVEEKTEFSSPLPPPPALSEPTKRRPFHGRSMSRIDELFMTVIRLKRQLPEKVLGHMFCISQPTVSRIIRAWTALLSKLVDLYPVENCNEKPKSSKAASKAPLSEHTYTSKGLGIPESFRQLFHSELAQSIVVTLGSTKSKKTTASPCKRQKKCNDVKESVEETSSSVDGDSNDLLNVISNTKDDSLHSDINSLLKDLDVEEQDLFQSVSFL